MMSKLMLLMLWGSETKNPDLARVSRILDISSSLLATIAFVTLLSYNASSDFKIAFSSHHLYIVFIESLSYFLRSASLMGSTFSKAFSKYFMLTLRLFILSWFKSPPPST